MKEALQACSTDESAATSRRVLSGVLRNERTGARGLAVTDGPTTGRQKPTCDSPRVAILCTNGGAGATTQRVDAYNGYDDQAPV
nr:unnamed protein product [Digitaria exilis]